MQKDYNGAPKNFREREY